MIFSPTPPTVAGAYWWKEDVDDCPLSLRDVFKHKDALVVRIRDGDLFTVQEFGGLWCRLVPVDEVEKAFKEAISEFEKNEYDSLQWWWERSHARKVVEGEGE